MRAFMTLKTSTHFSRMSMEDSEVPEGQRGVVEEDHQWAVGDLEGWVWDEEVKFIFRAIKNEQKGNNPFSSESTQ